MSKSSIRFPGKADEKLESVQKRAEKAVKRLQHFEIDKTFWSDNRPRVGGLNSDKKAEED